MEETGSHGSVEGGDARTDEGQVPFRQLVENAHEGIAIIQDERVVYCNERFADLFGTTPAVLKGEQFLTLVSEDERATVADRYERRLAEGDPPKQYRVTTDDGRILETTGTRIEFRGESADMAVVRDVTEQECYESALNGLHEVTGEFPYAKTHEEIAMLAVETGKDILDVASLHVCLLNEDDGVLETVATNHTADSTFETPDPTFEPGDTPVWRAFASGEQAWVEDSDCGTLASSETVTDVLAVPLGDHGVLLVEATAGDRDDQRFELVETLAATTTAALDRTDREMALRDREQELAATSEQLAQIRTWASLFGRVASTIHTETSRAELERAVCAAFVEDGPFDFAWVGRHDRGRDELVPSTMVGDDRSYLTDWTPALDDGVAEPTVVAARTGERQTVADTVTDQQAAPWRRSAAQRGFRSVVALPLCYEGVSYGVLGLYGPKHTEFDDFERAVLDESAEVVAAAINAMERRTALVADHGTELEFELSDIDCFLYRFARDAGCSLTVDGVVPESPSEDIVHVTVTGDGDTVRRLRTSANQSSVVDELRLLSEDGDGTQFALRLTEPFVGSTLAAHGLTLEKLRADQQSATITVGIPDSIDSQRAVEIVTNQYPDATLLAKRTDPRDNDRQARPQRPIDRLTDRQREVVERAYRSGYFDTPKGQTGEDLAAAMDISSSTFHDHLRRAQQTVFETLFADDDPTR